jgi:hypothetical protein
LRPPGGPSRCWLLLLLLWMLALACPGGPWPPGDAPALPAAPPRPDMEGTAATPAAATTIAVSLLIACPCLTSTDRTEDMLLAGPAPTLTQATSMSMKPPVLPAWAAEALNGEKGVAVADLGCKHSVPPYKLDELQFAAPLQLPDAKTTAAGCPMLQRNKMRTKDGTETAGCATARQPPRSAATRSSLMVCYDCTHGRRAACHAMIVSRHHLAAAAPSR